MLSFEKKSSFSFHLKLVSLLVLVSFTMTTASWAQGPLAIPQVQENAKITATPDRISIPSGFGTMEEFYHSTNGKPLVIFIRDAHAVVDAQKNIQDLIAYLQENYGISLVALEGGAGRLDSTLLRTFPNDAVRKKVLNGYLARAELTGAQMAAVFNPGEASYYGIEDWKLYEQNFLAYLRSQKNRDAILQDLERLRSELDRKRRLIYSPELNEFHEKVRAFKEEKSGLLDLLEYLKGMKEVEDKQAGLPHLKTLLDSVETERLINPEAAERKIRDMASRFRKENLGRLAKEKKMEFNGAYQDFITGKRDGASFLQYLVQFGESCGMPVRISADLEGLLAHARTLATIKGTKLFEELETLIRELENELAQKPEARELAG